MDIQTVGTAMVKLCEHFNCVFNHADDEIMLYMGVDSCLSVIAATIRAYEICGYEIICNCDVNMDYVSVIVNGVTFPVN